MEPVVNWKYIPSKFKYQAVDGSGDVYAFTHEPKPGNEVFPDVWDLIEGDCHWIGTIRFDDSTQVNWKESLIKRPQQLEQAA